MAEQLFDKFSNLPALEAEKNKILSLFEEIKKGIKSLSDSGIKLGSSSGKQQTDELVRETEKLKTLQGDLARQLAITKVQQEEARKSNKEAARDALGLNDAYKKLEQQYNALARAAKNAAIEQGEDSEAFKKLSREANELGERLKRTDASVGQFQRNVGNYANSLASSFESVRREIKRVQEEREKLVQNFQNRQQAGFVISKQDEERLRQVDSQLKQLNTTLETGFKVSGSANQQIKNLENSYIQLATSGNQSVEFLREFKDEIGRAKDEVRDLRQSINLAASDTRALDILIGGAQAVAGGFGVAQGFAAAFGNENENLQKTLVKLNGVMTLLNGLQAIQNELKKKDNILTVAQIALQKTYAFVVGTSTGAMKAFRIALAATGVGLLVIGLSSLISKMNIFSSSTDKTKKAVDRLTESFEAQNKAIEEINETIELQGQIRREGFKQAGADQKKLFEDELADKQRQLELLESREKDARDKRFKAEQQIAKQISDARKVADQAGVGLTLTRDAQEKISELGKVLNKEVGDAEKAASLKRLEIELFVAKEKTRIFEEGAKKKQEIESGSLDKSKELSRREKELAERNARAELEILKEKQQRVIDAQLDILQDEEENYEARLLAVVDFTAASRKIIDAESAYEISKEGLTAKEIEAINERKYTRLINLQKDSFDKIRAIREQFRDDQAELELAPSAVPDTSAGIEKANERIKQAHDFEMSLIAERKQAYDRLYASVAGAVQDIISGVFDAEKNRLQDQIDKVNELKSAEIERVRSGSDSEEKKAARIKIIEAKAQADREALERRQRQIDRNRAIFERASSAFSITIAGIKDVARIKSAAAVAFANVMATIPPPGNLPAAIAARLAVLKDIPLSIATTAASLAAILATPIPKFFSGTKHSPEGFAEVAERGPELAVDKEGYARLFDKHTITYLTKGTTIFPADVTRDIINASGRERENMIKSYTGNISVSLPGYGDKIDKQTDILKRIEQKSRIAIINNAPVESTAWYWNNFKN